MAKAFNGGSTTKIDYSSYCYDTLIDLINEGYSSKLRNKEDIREGFPGWSPNNVKRVIISPSGVIVEYHTTSGMKCNTRVRSAKFDPVLYNECINSEKYRSMVSAIASERICSGLEELVIITQSINNGLRLNPKELFLESIAIRTKGSIEEGIKDRFKRLCCLVITDVDIFSIQMFFKSKELLVKDWLQNNKLNCNVTPFNDKTWKTAKPNLQPLGSDGSGYIEDTEKGSVGRYFKARVAKFNELVEKEKLDELDNKRVVKSIEKDKEGIENCLKIIERAIKSYADLLKVVNCGELRNRLDSKLGELEGDLHTIVISSIKQDSIAMQTISAIRGTVDTDIIHRTITEVNKGSNEMAENLILSLLSNCENTEFTAKNCLNSLTGVMFAILNSLYGVHFELIKNAHSVSETYFKLQIKGTGDFKAIEGLPNSMDIANLLGFRDVSKTTLSSVDSSLDKINMIIIKLYCNKNSKLYKGVM